MDLFNGKFAEKGFIDKNKLLEYVSEKDIFEIVFDEIEEYEYITSPLREDSSPGCWFAKSPTGELKFHDFGSIYYRGKTQIVNIDCFDAIQIYFNIPNFYLTLQFIYDTLIKGKDIPKREIVKREYKHQEKRNETEILIYPRPFNIVDKQFWFDKYQIHKESLIEDKVFPISAFRIVKEKEGITESLVTTKTASYAYVDFKGARKKIYRPYERKVRFITNCTKNDIGGFRLLVDRGDKLIITKSYKDYRVLKNQGLNVIWFQNEGMFPSLLKLLPLCNRFEEVLVLFDNDEVGIKAATHLVEIINTYIPNKARFFHLPTRLLRGNITDSSDLIYKKGRNQLLEFLNYHNVF